MRPPWEIPRRTLAYPDVFLPIVLLIFYSSDIILAYMEKHQLDRLMRIAQKTQSPVIVLDENQEEVVILPLSAYEELIDDYTVEDFEFPEEFCTDQDFSDISEEFEVEELIDDSVVKAPDIQLEDLVEEVQELDDEVSILNDESGVELSEEQFYLEPVE